MKNLMSLCLLWAYLIPVSSAAQEPVNPVRADREIRIQELNRELDALNRQRAQLQRERLDHQPRIIKIEKRVLEREQPIERIRVRPELNRPTQEFRHDMPEAQRRIEHMAMAREHLMAAGLQDIAQAVTERSEHLERRVQRANLQRIDDPALISNKDEIFRREIRGAIRELSIAVQELREENQKIRQLLSDNR